MLYVRVTAITDISLQRCPSALFQSKTKWTIRVIGGGGGIVKVNAFPWLNENVIHLSNHCITRKAKNYIIL